MKLKHLYLTSGIPGSGKSTYVKSHFNKETDFIISRDFIRFNLLDAYNETDPNKYFAYEDTVFKIFIATINTGLEDNIFENIIVDATHLGQASREKVLSKLDLSNVEDVILLNFEVPLEVAIKRNSLRQGRERVPETAIQSMYKGKRTPSKSERDKWNMVQINIHQTNELRK